MGVRSALVARESSWRSLSGGGKKLIKMAEAKEVKLHGFWASPYCFVVHHALKLKGVAFESVEEDLDNKSESLLKLNPVHNKVPVLVVDGKPLAESLVIFEFIEEKWKEPPLLPEDPYKKAKVRFWADFFYKKLLPTVYVMGECEDEAQQKAAKEFKEHMSTLESGIQKDLPSDGPFINGDKPGLLDLIVGSWSGVFRVDAELVGMAELVEKEKVPLLHSCIASFSDHEVTKDLVVPHEKLLNHVRALREKALASAPK